MKISTYHSTQPRRRRCAWVLNLLLMTVLFGVSQSLANAQQEPVTSATVTQSTSAGGPSQSASLVAAARTDRDDRYRIGSGDVLDIRVFNKPILSRENVRVNGNGMIRMPLIEEDIMAACLTESELGKEIATRYLKYQNHPQVDVFIKEYQSQPVAVIGAVNQPSQFKLQRRVKLLELIAFANGPQQERAGRNVNVVHGEPSRLICRASTPTTEDDIVKTGLNTYKLKDTLAGLDGANPYVQPGDIIYIPEADQAYVIGNVVRPTPISLREPVTVSRAIAMAGGPQPDSRKEKIRIVRQVPDSLNQQEIYVDLKAVEKKQQPDIVLQANDIVDVPLNGTKHLLKSFIGAIVPSLGNSLPTRIVY